MLNYEVDPAVLTPYVPAGTELDDWNGKIYISLVGFLFLRTKVLGVSVPLHQNFEEVNLRFYVRRFAQGELRRGVVFIKEVVPRPAITLVARWAYNENYVTMPMAHELRFLEKNAAQLEEVRYIWGSGTDKKIMEISVEGPSNELEPGSEEEFITEHFWGYTRQRDGSTMEYQVAHPRWRIWQARKASFHGDATNLYGKRFGEILDRQPDSAFLADGSTVTVYKGVAITEEAV
jgi:uncharacterized protein